ncbi:hypothetical protein A4X13_0g9477, partial [Tilletia indica]
MQRGKSAQRSNGAKAAKYSAHARPLQSVITSCFLMWLRLRFTVFKRTITTQYALKQKCIQPHARPAHTNTNAHYHTESAQKTGSRLSPASTATATALRPLRSLPSTSTLSNALRLACVRV